VLVAVLALLVLAAPQAHTLRPVMDRLRQAGPLPSVAVPTLPRGAGTDGGVCPVRGRVRIGQGWGAPRDGGRRRHQGIDLLAPPAPRWSRSPTAASPAPATTSAAWVASACD
jgi:hypothetical protein